MRDDRVAVAGAGSAAGSDVRSRIDLHCHVAPAAYLELPPAERLRLGIPDAGHTADELAASPARLGDWLRERDLDAAVVSLAPLVVSRATDPVPAADAARAANEALAAWAGLGKGVEASSPAIEGVLATVPLIDGTDAVRELRWAADHGFVGAQITTSAGTTCQPLHDPMLAELWAVAETTGMLLLVHPVTATPDPRLRGRLENLVGNPIETGMAAASLILGGVLSRHPRLRVVLAHGGGALLTMLGRWDRAVAIGRAGDVQLDASPREVARRMWVDTVTHSPALLRHIAEELGTDRIVIGTDRPFPLGEQDPIGALTSAGLDASTIATIATDNALAALGRA